MCCCFYFYIQIISFWNTNHDFNYSHQFIFIKKESDSSAYDLNWTISVSFILERPTVIRCAMPLCIQFELCLHSKWWLTDQWWWWFENKWYTVIQPGRTGFWGILQFPLVLIPIAVCVLILLRDGVRGYSTASSEEFVSYWSIPLRASLLPSTQGQWMELSIVFCRHFQKTLYSCHLHEHVTEGIQINSGVQETPTSQAMF